MGNPSILCFIPTSRSTTPINWAHVPEASKNIIDRYGYDWVKDVTKPLPETVADLAKMFNETKFFGYFDPDILTALMDISKFGLKAAAPTSRSITQAGPRFYMTYVDRVWFFLFVPGKRGCIAGYSDRIIMKLETEQDFNNATADEEVMAKEFDVQLEQEVSRRNGKFCSPHQEIRWMASIDSSIQFGIFTVR